MKALSDSEAAAELAERISNKLIDPAKVDEEERPADDQPPAFADAIFSETPISVSRAVDLTDSEWELVAKALEHYAECRAA